MPRNRKPPAADAAARDAGDTAAAPQFTDWPAEGGRYLRDPATGRLTRLPDDAPTAGAPTATDTPED